MTEQEVIAVIEQWRNLLIQVKEVNIDVDMDFSEIRARIADRQPFIDRIQALDASVQKTGALRDEGWPGMSAAAVEQAETLIRESRAIRDEILVRDREIGEKSKDIKLGLSHELRKVNKGKGYLASNRALKERPALIVDDHA